MLSFKILRIFSSRRIATMAGRSNISRLLRWLKRLLMKYMRAIINRFWAGRRWKEAARMANRKMCCSCRGRIKALPIIWAVWLRRLARSYDLLCISNCKKMWTMRRSLWKQQGFIHTDSWKDHSAILQESTYLKPEEEYSTDRMERIIGIRM